jgi:hypothetical protein
MVYEHVKLIIHIMLYIGLMLMNNGILKFKARFGVGSLFQDYSHLGQYPTFNQVGEIP